ncbi:MAG TPA: hypothetical protein VF517_03810 [Thermoleophilaceae bacterium]
MSDFDPQGLFERLGGAGIDYVVIGGWAVNAHGHRRLTADLDICPSPARDNLERLARLLAELGAEHLGADEFERNEVPGDPTDPDSLALGGNFRLTTELGGLDLMQWLTGLDTERAYERLASRAIEADVFGVRVRVCSLDDLLAMKRAAGRPVDREDIDALSAD